MTSCGDRKPQEIFNAVLGNEKMNSAKVIHAEDQDFGECCIWLHFTIDSIELSNEIKNCTEHEIFSCDSIKFEAKWWNPNKMGKGIKCYTRHLDREFEEFYVNKSMTEVYYQNYLQ